MAKRTIEVLTDDIDGTELKDRDGQSLTFSVGGARYEIDLSQKNVDKFFNALTPYMENGRKVSGRRPQAAPAATASTTGKTAARTDKEQLQAIRDWARDQGLDVSSRGRISKQIMDAYSAAS